MYLLPFVNDNLDLQDGSFVHTFHFCNENIMSSKCMQHYKSLFLETKTCFKKCPFGLVSYIHTDDKQKTIFTCLREATLYQKKNKRFLNESVYNPILTKEQISVLVETSVKKQYEKEIFDEKVESFDAMTHEVKKLNSQIKEYCDSLINFYSEKNDYMALSTEEYAMLFEKIKSLYIISSMITSRYTIYDYDKNPSVLSVGSQFKSSIHGKFLKSSKILKNYKKKNNFINFDGETHKYLMAFPSFEMIPFLLIENALKYALEDSEINVKFIDNSSSLKMEIISFSPYCSQDDSSHIFEKGFRGKNAKKTTDGNGIGLYFVKLICDLHNISISVQSDSNSIKQINGIPYANFFVDLVFHEVFDTDY